MPMSTGNAATLIEDYEDSFRQMAEAVDDAKRYVLCEFYILAVDETTAPVLRRARGGGRSAA